MPEVKIIKKGKGPTLPMTEPFFAAGIDPKTRLPIRAMDNKPTKADYKKWLRHIDEQDAVNRYVWYNLPANITSQELERMLYYKGQLILFYDKTLEEFYFMPYALDGTIDFYGRFNTVHPIPMTAGTEQENKSQIKYLSGLKLKCVYGMKMEVTKKDLDESCVILRDFTNQLSQTSIPRAQLNDPILDQMAEIMPLCRTNMIASSGIEGVRVNDADQQQNVWEASKALEVAALNGHPWIPIVGSVDFQELTKTGLGKTSDYFLAMQSLDNLRLSGYGIDNGGLFQKKAHELEREAAVNGAPVGLVLQDGLSLRQNFCNIANSIWNCGMWCEPAENIALTGREGVYYDENEGGENSGVSPAEDMEQGGQDDEI